MNRAKKELEEINKGKEIVMMNHLEIIEQLKEQNDILSETVRNLNCRLEILQEENVRLRNCQNCRHEFENVQHCNPYTNERDKWESK